jgi:hypothetical protein
MADAGHSIAIHLLAGVNTDSAPANYAATTGEAGGIESITMGRSRIALDRTDFKDPDGVMKRFMGLKDGSFQISGFWDPADTALVEVETVFEGASNAILWVNVTWNATYAKIAMCVVEDFELSGEVEGRVEFSATLSFTNAVAAGLTS